MVCEEARERGVHVSWGAARGTVLLYPVMDAQTPVQDERGY